MSIYSGFATRQQQQSYDSLIVDLICVLQRRIIKFYSGEEADEGKFHAVLLNLHHHLARIEESKYLQPKIAGTFKELLALTAGKNSSQQPQPAHIQLQPRPPQSQQQNRSRQTSIPKESLNFSTDRIARDIKSSNIGKIRHQSPAKDGISSKGESNPQNIFDKRILLSYNSHNPKELLGNNQKQGSKQMQKWGCIFDSDPPALPQQEEKKNIQYIIREYVNKGQRRRPRKRTGAD